MERPKTPFDYVALTAGLVMVGVFLFGFIRFSDGPIHECREHGYCGKQGQAHTADDYRAFQIWEGLLAATWIPGAIVLYLHQRRKLAGDQ